MKYKAIMRSLAAGEEFVTCLTRRPGLKIGSKDQHGGHFVELWLPDPLSLKTTTKALHPDVLVEVNRG